MTKTLLAGRYLLEEQIARVGMGEVWRARDEVLDRPVAVKLLHESLAGDETAAERFRREAMTAAQVSHPNMANVFDYIEADGTPGIVMEYVPSETLAHRLARKRPPVRDSVAIADAVLAALEAAHAAGIVHRDIKPANILLAPNGDVKVTDFGIARSLSDSSLTQTGTVMGTAHYSAPEQVSGDHASPATDLYAVGVVLYEMLTGARPFGGDTPVAVAMARLSDDPPRPKEVRPAIPTALDAVVMRALARDPAKRFSSASEMRARLDLAAGDTPLDQTQVLEIEGADPTMMIAGPMPPPEKKRKLAAVVPPAWAGKRIAKVLVPAIVAMLLVWGMIAAFGGPTMTKVPAFANKTMTQAISLAKSAHLLIHEQLVTSPSKPKDTVLGQDLTAGASVKAGTVVTLRVSSGPPACCKIPDLSGMTLADAQTALANIGLQVGDVTQTVTSDAEPGTVIDQTPVAGKYLNPGAHVDLVVAQAPAPPPRKHGKHGEG
ncbi:MAG: Stk1 family PASTA domain-containing Ser/Thr kinase [Actinomycetota bacterium]